MKLSDYRVTYEQFSGKLSDIARQMAFAGIALIWLFKVDSKPVPSVPRDLLPPTVLLVTGLLFDLLQYIIGTVIWQRFHRKHEKLRTTIDEDETLEAPWYYPAPISIVFWLKIGFILAGLAWIAIYAAIQWWH